MTDTSQKQEKPDQYPTCAHVRADGRLCQSPALTDETFCYFHHRDQKRRRNLQQARNVKNTLQMKSLGVEALEADILESLDLPLLEDPAAIQVALTTIIRAVAYGHLDPRRARVLLYGLQLAAANARLLRVGEKESFLGPKLTRTDPAPIKPLAPEFLYLEKRPGTQLAEGRWDAEVEHSKQLAKVADEEAVAAERRTAGHTARHAPRPEIPASLTRSG
jgi:hypothetical protein